MEKVKYALELKHDWYTSKGYFIHNAFGQIREERVT